MGELLYTNILNSPSDRIKVTFKDALIILIPYIWKNLKEQLIAVLPIVFYLTLFQLLLLRTGITQALLITVGICFVIVGLMFFMEGLNLGLMPLGETIGRTLPRKSILPFILLFAFLTGMGATFAEPAIGVLKAAGQDINQTLAPLLFGLLNDWSFYLVFAVGFGVGIATVFGVLRLLYDWSLRILVIPLVIVVSLLTVLAHIDPVSAAIIGLAWDCGGVTTGPVTVPLVLSLGIGVASITGRADTGMSGFGIVTLASLFPIITVLILGLTFYYTGEKAKFIGLQGKPAAAKIATGAIPARDNATTDNPTPSRNTPAPTPLGAIGLMKGVMVKALVNALRAILPLCLFLYLVQVAFLREKLRKRDEVFLGIGFALFGMMLFNFGLGVGLTSLGRQVGGNVPYAATLYGDVWMKVIAVIFAFLMGFGATLAEPALNALGLTVEDITVGAFKKSLLMKAVAFGVGCGVGLGVIKIMFNLPLAYLLLPPYGVLLLVTWVSREEFVNIGWDSAGVTTGPITVPLVIAMGLGLGSKMGVVEGFGIISTASVCPIISVLLLGLINKGTKYKER